MVRQRHPLTHYSNDKFVPEFTEGYLLGRDRDHPREEKFGSLNSPARRGLPGDLRSGALSDEAQPEGQRRPAAHPVEQLLTQREPGRGRGVLRRYGCRRCGQSRASWSPTTELAADGRMTRTHLRACFGSWAACIRRPSRADRLLPEKAQAAKEPQKTNIAALVSYYKTGDLKEFDRYNIGWVKDTVSKRRFRQRLHRDYGDPLGRKASWEANVNFMDSRPATARR